jgi:hypothetical protein
MLYSGVQYYETIYLECRGIAELTLVVTHQHQTVQYQRNPPHQYNAQNEENTNLIKNNALV